MAPSSAEALRLGAWEGAIEGTAESARQDVETNGLGRTRFDTRRREERLTLRNTGIIVYDPRLLRLSLGGTVGLSQEWLGTDGGSAFHQGTLWGYDTSADLLSDGAYALRLFANRNQFLLSRPLAGRSEARHEDRGVTLFARRLYLPSTLTLRQELQEDESLTAGLVTRREDRRNVLTYEGQRGWIDSELDLRYEHVDLLDRVFPGLGYKSHEGSLAYSRDLGPELNWRWDSRLRLFTRTGVTDLTMWTLDESLGADHTERLRTDYRYFLIHTATSGGAATTQTGAFNLRHRLYESLITTVGLDTIFQTLPGGRRNTQRGRLDFAYTKQLPHEARLNAGLGGGLQYSSDRFGVTESFVAQESHTAASPIALPIALDNPFVVALSVVVTKVATGPLPSGCLPPPGPPTPLVLGQDYTLRTVGEITEIVPIPCAVATPGINPGDTIAVDYRFSVSPSLSFRTATWRTDLSVDFRWIRPYLVHEQSEQNLVSGQDGRFLDDQQSDTVGAELRHDSRRLRASLVGERRQFISRRVTYHSVRSAQFADFSIAPEWTLSLSADQAVYDYSHPSRMTRTWTERATLTYVLDAGLVADLLGGMRRLRDSLVPSERTTEASLRIRWFIRELEVDPLLEYFDRRRGETDTKEQRAMVHIIRRF